MAEPLSLPRPDDTTEMYLGHLSQSANWNIQEAAQRARGRLVEAQEKATMLESVLRSGRVGEAHFASEDLEYAARGVMVSADELRDMSHPFQGADEWQYMHRSADEMEQYGASLARSTQDLGELARGITHDRQQVSGSLDGVVRYLEERLDMTGGASQSATTRPAASPEMLTALESVRRLSRDWDQEPDPEELERALGNLNLSLNSVEGIGPADIEVLDQMQRELDERLDVSLQREQRLAL